VYSDATETQGLLVKLLLGNAGLLSNYNELAYNKWNAHQRTGQTGLIPLSISGRHPYLTIEHRPPAPVCTPGHSTSPD